MTQALIPARATDAQFLGVFNRLCVALREPGDDTGVKVGIYWDALRDLPLPAIEAGAGVLMREPGRRFFPTTAEWRTEAEKAKLAQLREAVAPGRDRPWAHDCTACEDTGWELFECPAQPCDRAKAHAPHSYVRVCPCRPTNPTYLRHQHFGRGGE